MSYKQPGTLKPRRHRTGTILVIGLLLSIVGVVIALVRVTLLYNQSEIDPNTLVDHQNGHMLIASSFTVLDSTGNSAGDAVVTLASQQRLTSADGVVYFDHLMLHRNDRLHIYYKGENYSEALHLHNFNTVQLGWSNEFRHLLVAGLGAVLLVQIFLLAMLYLRSLFKKDRRLPGFKGRWQHALAVLVVILLLVEGLTVSSVWFSETPAASAAVLDTLPVPNNVAVKADDGNAVVTWGEMMRPDIPNPPNVVGYKISWGLSGQPLANVSLTQFRALQVQPLVNGQNYQLQIQSMDKMGNVSRPTAPISFSGNTSRTNALRSQMTGFFDDFNTAAGSWDDRKWNNAYDLCGDPAIGSFFVNTQTHVHNLVGTGDCDRIQNISRARQIFDFSGRTGTLVFDMDGLFGRDFWYLDLVPDLHDITGHIHLDDEGVSSGPANTLRLRQNGHGVAVLWVDASGKSRTLLENNWSNFDPLDWVGMPTIPNLRRQWQVKISTSYIEIKIDGKVALAGNISLPYSRAHVLWTQFSYGAAKDNQPYTMLHWDNFGFDGPKSNTTTHNYPLPQIGGGDAVLVEGSKSASLNIPDAISGQQTAERLMFSVMAYQYGDVVNDTDSVTVNGTKFTIPKPKSGNISVADLVQPLAAWTVTVPLPKGTLKQGANNLQYSLKNRLYVFNVHAEVDYPSGSVPAYTQPNRAKVTASGIPALPDIGPGATFTKVGSKAVDINWDSANNPTYPVSGAVDISFEVDNFVAMIGHGKNPGISRVDVLMDKKVIQSIDVGGTVAHNGVFKLNTTQFSNGYHEFFVKAFNPAGTPSFPQYFLGGAKSGDYLPLKLNISNANPGPTATPPPNPATPTKPANTATPVPATPTKPPATATKPANTATVAPPTATKPANTATPVPATPTKPANTPTVAPPTATPTANTATPTKPPSTATVAPPTATKPASTATPTKPPTASNLLLDGGFENNGDTWELYDSFTVVRNTQARSGQASLRLRSDDQSWTNAVQYFDVQPNKEYTLTFWAKGSKTPYVDILTLGWNTLYRVEVKATTGYTQYTLKFNSQNNTRLGMVIRNSGGTGTSFFDDFEIK
jgi:Carbohydrate binding domain